MFVVVSSVRYYVITMRGDFFTKPTQGKLFRWQRDQVMGLAPESTYPSEGIRSDSYPNEENYPNERSVLVADESSSESSWVKVVRGKGVKGKQAASSHLCLLLVFILIGRALLNL